MDFKVSNIDASTFSMLNLEPGADSEMNADMHMSFAVAPAPHPALGLFRPAQALPARYPGGRPGDQQGLALSHSKLLCDSLADCAPRLRSLKLALD
jgi:hypothetical protein